MVNVVRPTGGLTPARPDAVVRVGNPLQGLFWRAGSSYGERVEWRIQRWRWRRLGWPELSPATTLAVVGARVSSGSRLGRTIRRVRGIYGPYEMRRGQWTGRRGHCVAGSTSAVSSGGSASGCAWCGDYGEWQRERRGGGWSVAHGGCKVASACSGKHRSVRNGEGDLRRPATKMTKMVMMQGLRCRVTRWRGRGRCGGASGLLEGAR